MSLASAITLSSLELTRFFFAMVLLLFTAHSFGFLFYEVKLPRVIGEIFGGLVLGPTFLGYVAPDAENWVFGAFLAGIAIGMMPEEVFALAKAQVKSISLAVFTPVYFAVVGLKLDLIHSFDILFFLGFLIFSTALKGGGALVVGRLIKQKRLPSLNLAIALNARGGPGIVLATVAFDMGLISETFFVALVLTAIVTSLIAGFWLRYVKKKGWELL